MEELDCVSFEVEVGVEALGDVVVAEKVGGTSRRKGASA
jgi:hypothetical protein